MFEQLNQGGKRGNDEIKQISYLPRCGMIALLSSSIINIVHIQNLKSAQEIKNKKVHLFCVNNAVYSNESKGKPLVMFD